MARFGSGNSGSPLPSEAFSVVELQGAIGNDRDLVLLIPLYNDWKACQLLLSALDESLNGHTQAPRVILVDDGSSEAPEPDFPGETFRTIDRVDVLQLRRNLGHQRAIAVGLAYVWEHVPCRRVVLMDSDGEDAPSDVPRLLARFDQVGGGRIIFAERTRRSESWMFIFFYNLYKVFHRVLIGFAVRVGNFSVIPRERLDSLIVVSELWNHYAAAVVKSRQPFGTIPTRRATRLSGRSSMDFVRLVAHGLSAISVFGDVIGVRLLVATLGLIVLTVLGLVATLTIRLATDLSIPGWASSILGILTVLLFQAVMLSIQFSFIILGGRQGTTFLPCRDYAYFVGSFRNVARRSPGDDASKDPVECNPPTTAGRLE
jgi:polyisoprenyl-phosphate glycosyltransferase